LAAIFLLALVDRFVGSFTSMSGTRSKIPKFLSEIARLAIL